MTIEIPKNVEVIEVVGLKEWLEEHDKQIRADAIEEFSQIIAMDIADCSKCPLDCEVNTYGGCEEMLKTYVLEQLKTQDSMK